MIATTFNILILAYLLILPCSFSISCLIQIFSRFRNEKFFAALTLNSLLLQGIVAIGLLTLTLAGFEIPKAELLLPFPGLDHIQISKTGLLILLLSATLCYITGNFSKQYLHREQGFARFYSLLTVFCYGMLVAANTSSLESMYIGWEIVGLTSFLLIAFFYDREKSVHRAIRILAWYKLSDYFLLIAIAAQIGSSSSPALRLLTEICFCLAVLIKSAQLPFSYWLPWALEGPSPSSAVFYGGLGIHLGALGLLAYTANQELSAIGAGMLVSSAVITLILARLAQKIQPDAKSIIVYGVMTQISIIILEIVLGFRELALWHIIGHAILRTYQILTVGGIIHDHPAQQWRNIFPDKLLKLPKITNSRLAQLLLLESSKEVHFVHWPLILISRLAHNITDRFYHFRRVAATRSGISLQLLDLVLLTTLLLLVGLVYFDLSSSTLLLQFSSLMLLTLAFILIFSSNGITYVGKSFLAFHLALILIQRSIAGDQHTAIFIFDELLTILIAFAGLIYAKRCLSKRFGANFSNIHSGLMSVCPAAGFCIFISILSLSGFPGTLGAISEESLIHQLSTAPIFLFIIPFAYTALGWCGYRRFADTFYGRCSVHNPELYRLSKTDITIFNILSLSSVLLAIFRMI